MDLHIGEKIKAVVKEKGISVSEFARRISTSRENVYGIFRRKTIDTGMLYKISITLDHDFFRHYLLNNQTEKELQLCRKEVELLRKEIEQLQNNQQGLS